MMELQCYDSDYLRPGDPENMSDQLILDGYLCLTQIFSNRLGSLVLLMSILASFSFPLSSHARVANSRVSITPGMYYDKKKSKTQSVDVINTTTGEVFGHVQDFRPYFPPMRKRGIPQKLGDTKKPFGIPKGQKKHPFHGYVSPGILYPVPLIKLEKQTVDLLFIRSPRVIILAIPPNHLVIGFPISPRIDQWK